MRFAFGISVKYTRVYSCMVSVRKAAKRQACVSATAVRENRINELK